MKIYLILIPATMIWLTSLFTHVWTDQCGSGVMIDNVGGYYVEWRC